MCTHTYAYTYQCRYVGSNERHAALNIVIDGSLVLIQPDNAITSERDLLQVDVRQRLTDGGGGGDRDGEDGSVGDNTGELMLDQRQVCLIAWMKGKEC